MDSNPIQPYGSARVSGARRLIAQCVERFTGAFTVEELSLSVREANRAASATATVYRAVAAMEGSGYLERVGERGGSALFTRCAHPDHHHHIICEGCGTTAAARCPVGEGLASAAEQEGFTITRHVVTLYGLCPACRQKASA